MNKSQLQSGKTQSSCISRTMVIVGNKWTLLIVNELAGGCTRFCELQKRLNNINPRTLSCRLQELESENIIERLADDTGNLQNGYRLTDKGIDLIPILKQMSRWGDKYPCQDNTPV